MVRCDVHGQQVAQGLVKTFGEPIGLGVVDGGGSMNNVALNKSFDNFRKKDAASVAEGFTRWAVTEDETAVQKGGYNEFMPTS